MSARLERQGRHGHARANAVMSWFSAPEACACALESRAQKLS